MADRTLRDGALLAMGAGMGVALATYLRTRQNGIAATGGDGQAEAYNAPKWTPDELNPPGQRLRLAHLPTPIHRWEGLPGVDSSVAEVWIKRDDCTGCELSGNKVRKLEFLLAEALAGGFDSVITVGGIQSNHCRATAAAARRVGLTAHIILRTKAPDSDPGLVGNLMLDRMVGANIHLVSDEEFSAKGGWGLVCELKEKLEKEQGAKPYPFPSGGSNDVGTWGYVQAIAEIEQQSKDLGVEFDAVYYACGSGGTGAGLALGMHASSLQGELVGLCVDDTPQECVAPRRSVILLLLPDRLLWSPQVLRQNRWYLLRAGTLRSIFGVDHAAGATHWSRLRPVNRRRAKIHYRCQQTNRSCAGPSVFRQGCQRNGARPAASGTERPWAEESTLHPHRWLARTL